MKKWGADKPEHDPMTPQNGMRGPTHSSFQLKGWDGRAVGEFWAFCRPHFSLWFISKPCRRNSSFCAAWAARPKPSAPSCFLACTRCALDAWRRGVFSALSARRRGPTLLRKLWITCSSRACSGAWRCSVRSWMCRLRAPAAKSRLTSGVSSVNSSCATSASRRTSGTSSTRPVPWPSSATAQFANSSTVRASPTSSAPIPTIAPLRRPSEWSILNPGVGV